jgi:hypothetical protein
MHVADRNIPRRQNGRRTIKASVVGLNVSFGDFAVLNHKSVALAAGIAKDGGTIKGQIKGRSELAVRVGKETDARFTGGVQGSTPGAHAGSMLAV